MAKLDNKTMRKETASSQKHYWLRTTKLCNNNCIFCLDTDTRNGTTIPLDELATEIEKGAASGAERLIISGGEATLHPDFFEIIRLGKAAGYRRIQVVTNGRMFSYKNFIDQAIAAGLDETTFSMHGHTAELHDAQTRVKGSFHQALSGLLNALESHRLIVNIDIVINRMNYEVINEIMDFFIDLGIHEFDLLHVTPFGEAWKNRDSVFYDPATGMKYLRRAFDYSRRENLFVWTNRFPPSYLADYPELIQNPVKILDEVRGRRDLLSDFATGARRLPCRGERCSHCFLRGFCDHLAKAKKELLSGTITSLRINAPELPDALALTGKKTGRLIIAGRSIRELESTFHRAVPQDASLFLFFDDYSGAEKSLKKINPSKVFMFISKPEDLEYPAAHRGIKAYFELCESNREYISGNFPIFYGTNTGLFVRNRASLAESRENDVDMADFFNRADAGKTRTANIPACMGGASVIKIPWAVPFSAITEEKTVDPDKMALDYITNYYYVHTVECERCARKKTCPGVHINYLRSFGFTPAPFES